jgi:hypothetical protein
VLLLVVVADAVGLLGVHTSTVTTSAAGHGLTLSYPHVARAGLDTRWQVQVRHAGGFSKPITLVVTGAYFNIYEEQGWRPVPHHPRPVKQEVG